MEKYIGIIGGSGLYKMDGVKIEEERAVKTTFGDPSDKLLIGSMEGAPVVFLSRHGRGHRFNPSEVNYRANIFALKVLGVSRILSVTAVGSMKEKLGRGHVVIVDQFIDRTRSRPYTFFDRGIAVHVGFADPVCLRLVDILYNSAKEAGAAVQKGGTYVCIEGPMFSTRAESNLYRSWGVDVIGMTCYQEAKLAREAEICYATMAMVTDYDCWHEDEEDVDVPSVLKVMQKNAGVAQEIIKKAIPRVYSAIAEGCSCNRSAENAILTDTKLISGEVRERLAPIIGRYLR